MRILLADSQAKVRFALRVLLERQQGMEIVGEAPDADNLLAQAEDNCPDMVLLAWELPGLEPGQHFPALRRIRTNLVIVALSGRSEVSRAALDAGADAFVSKGDPPEQLLAAIAACACNQQDQIGLISAKEASQKGVHQTA